MAFPPLRLYTSRAIDECLLSLLLSGFIPVLQPLWTYCAWCRRSSCTTQRCVPSATRKCYRCGGPFSLQLWCFMQQTSGTPTTCSRCTSDEETFNGCHHHWVLCWVMDLVWLCCIRGDGFPQLGVAAAVLNVIVCSWLMCQVLSCRVTG